MVRSLARRLARLETRRSLAGPRVIGILDDSNTGADAGTVQLCRPGGGGERMTLDEWRRRYPNGMLIQFVYGEEDG